MPMRPSRNHWAGKFQFRGLAASRDLLTEMTPDPDVELQLARLLQSWREDPHSATPLQDLRALLEQLRARERGDRRIAGMNTLVRCLGERHNLAEFLHMLRDAIQKDGTQEQEIALISQQGKWHSIYGWCGQTIAITSASDLLSVTSKANHVSVAERLEYPRALWWISIHVWQPNARAAGFPSGKLPEPDLIMEPPHTHPFDFVSMVSVGKLRQSVYQVKEYAGRTGHGRYDGVTLRSVDGVWPPHQRAQPTELETVEERVELTEGDSYFLPYTIIHDVEVSASEALTSPAITLFMASESLDLANVYMAEAMVQYHEANPDLLMKARPMSKADWENKLIMLADYLQGKASALRLSDLVDADTDYAFFHV